MAGEVEKAKDWRAHEGTYDFFKSLMKWGTIMSAIITLIVVVLIT